MKDSKEKWEVAQPALGPGKRTAGQKAEGTMTN